MQEKYVDDIYKPGVNHCFRIWANGRKGSIYDIEDNCVLRFIELTSDGTYYKYKEEDWKEKSPILASGIVAWWLLYRRSKSVYDIFESYYHMRLAQYKVQREKEPDSWKSDIEEEFLNKEWLVIEKKCVKTSQALFDFISKKDVNDIQSVINNYWSFVEHTKLTSKVNSHMNTDALMELEYKILDFLSLNGKEIDSNKKGESKQLYDFNEFRLYTTDEIREASLDMQKKGWIYCYVDDNEDGLGPAYWHELLDPGRIALREYLEKYTGKTKQPIIVEKQIEKTEDYDDWLIPKELNTEKAQKYFQKALDKGYMQRENNKFKWIGVSSVGVKTQLAYFCGRIYNYKHSLNGNLGENFPEEKLCQLFNTKNLYNLLVQVYNAKKTQSWRSIIDSLFED